MDKLKQLFCVSALLVLPCISFAAPERWQAEWPETDFSKSSIKYDEILSGGPPKDGIPAIDHPVFIPVDKVDGLEEQEGVITLEINKDARIYPLRILMWHEIVNDTVGGVAVAITYCPLCNAAIVFERQLTDGVVLDFGTTGKLRHSDLVMYDRQTQSWWQQFTGEAIVGTHTGTFLNIVPSRLQSWQSARDDYRQSKVLIPNDTQARAYGLNPYVGYAKSAKPFLYGGDFPKGIAPMAPVLVVGDKAWALAYLQEKKTVTDGTLKIEWRSGMASALEGETVFLGEDIGNIIVRDGGKDMAHHLTFAFAFHAFYPDKEIIQ